jgi:uncharacterized protein YecE (DUF72 family)
MPTQKGLTNMLAQSGNVLKYSIKGHQSFTHSIELCQWKDAVKSFREALYPLQKAEALTTVLLEFPPTFNYNIDRRKYLASLIAEFGDVPLTVEFRNKAWHRESVYEGLRERGIAFCMVDTPGLAKLPQYAEIITAPLAYIRFHGRNAATWYGTNARDRYDYLYSDEELETWKPRLISVSGKAKTTQIFFNNHAKGAATVDAKKLMTLFESEEPETL